MSKCRKYRLDVALLVGNDLEASARLNVERHLAICPDCRSHRQSLLEGQQVLERFRAAEDLRGADLRGGGTSVADDRRNASEPAVFEPAIHESAAAEASSVWPQLKRQIRVLDDRTARGTWRGWLPAGALAAACLAVALITSDMLSVPQAGGEFARQPIVSPGIPVRATPTIVPIGTDEFTPRRFPAGEPDAAPRRRIDRNQRLNEGLLRSL